MQIMKALIKIALVLAAYVAAVLLASAAVKCLSSIGVAIRMRKWA